MYMNELVNFKKIDIIKEVERMRNLVENREKYAR